MEGIYWESADSFSDLDGSWSPGSSASHFSEQENYHNQQQQQQQLQQTNVNYYTGGQELLGMAQGQLVDAYGSFCEQPGQQQQQDIQIKTSDILQSCMQNQTQQSTKTSSSIASKKPKHPVRRVHQRNAANMRERRRMKTINDAFEGLRERIPLASGDRKLSKVDTLRLAIRYIHQLTDIVSMTGSSSSGQAREQEPAKVIIRYHNNTGYPDPYSENLYQQEQYPLYGHSLSWQGHKPIGMCPENKMAAKVWTPQMASQQDMEEMSSYVS